MKKPNLFIVGKPKCGTTTLSSFLKHHPEIFMSTPKEPNYFCTDFHKEKDRYHKGSKYFSFETRKDYLKLFKDVKYEKIIGSNGTSRST